MSLARISVIVPAHNEAGYITACLSAVLASDLGGREAELIVAANACTDSTVALARGFETLVHQRGWALTVLDIPEPGKLNALNEAERVSSGNVLIYLDADVEVSQTLLRELADALDTSTARYASGTPVVVAQTRFARAYSRFWARLPFVTDGVPGFGIFAVNKAGRARWDSFPDIISDDTFVRLSFTPQERIKVLAPYTWPSVEGFANLVRVRRRQDVGVREIEEKFPQLLQNDTNPSIGLGQIAAVAVRDPIGFVAYAIVKLAVKTPLARGARWARGR